MKNKTCGDCKSFPGMGYYCPIIGRFCDPNNEKPCEFFEKPMGRIATNGDKIRQMSDKNLAIFLGDRVYCFTCPTKGVPCFDKPKDVCYQKWLEWLNAPAGKDNNVPAKESEVANE